MPGPAAPLSSPDPGSLANEGNPGPQIDDQTTVRQRQGVPPGFDPLQATDEPAAAGEVAPSAESVVLTLDVVAPRQVRVGEPIDFVLHIGQRHIESLEDVQIECRLEEGLVYPGMSEQAFRQRLGKLAPGEKQEVELSLVCQQPGEHCVRFQLTADGVDPLEVSHCVRAASQSIGLEITGPTQRTVGSTAEYVLTIINFTGGDVPGVSVDVQHDSILAAP